jgi:putative membrane protein
MRSCWRRDTALQRRGRGGPRFSMTGRVDQDHPVGSPDEALRVRAPSPPPPKGDVLVGSSHGVEMNAPIKGKPVADLRDYLAEERTFLAWIRTGVGAMGFGFVVARFGISGDEPHAVPHAAVPPHELSLWFGIALVAVGVVVNLLSVWRYARLVGELNRGELVHRSLSKRGVVLAICLALLGMAIATSVILVLGPQSDALHS